MKKILLLLTLITFSAFAQNPDYHRYGVRTPFTKYISYTTAQRDALTPTSTDRTIIHHKDTGINRLEQWDGDSWEELGGDGAVSSVNFKTGAVVINPDDLDDSETTNKFVTQEEKDLINSAIQTETDPIFNAWDKDYNDLINKPSFPTNYITTDTDQSITGIQKTFTNTNKLYANRIINNNPSESSIGLYVANNTSYGIHIDNEGAYGLSINNDGDIGLGVFNPSGTAIQATSTGTGLNFEGKNGTTTTFTVNKEGNVTSNSFIKQGGTSSEYLMADGSVSTGGGGGGAVDSVNGQTGDVVLDADDISDTSTTNKFVTSTEKGLIATALQDAPSDGNEYVRKDGDWEVATGGGDNIYTADGTLTGDRSINIGEYSLSVKDSLENILWRTSNIYGTSAYQYDGTKVRGFGTTVYANGPDLYSGILAIDTSDTEKKAIVAISNTDTTKVYISGKKIFFEVEGEAPITGDVWTLQADGTSKFQAPSGGGGTDDQTASEVPFTPYSTIAATNVQDAIEEVLDEIPTSLAAANITVSPSIGGNTDAYAVMDDHEDRINDLESSMPAPPNLTYETLTYTASQTVSHDALRPNRVITTTGNWSLTLEDVYSGVSGKLLIKSSDGHEIKLNGATGIDFTSQGDDVLAFYEVDSTGDVHWRTADPVTKELTSDGDTTISFESDNYYLTLSDVDDLISLETPTFPKEITLTIQQGSTTPTDILFENNLMISGGVMPTLTQTTNAVDVWKIKYDNGKFYVTSIVEDYENVAGTAPLVLTPIIRVNNGGSEITATDGEINWLDGSGTSGTGWSVSGGNPSTSAAAITWARHASIPSSIPDADFQTIFDSSRYTSGTMTYTFTVPNGNYEVQIFLGEQIGSGTGVTFDITIEGNLVEDDGYLPTIFGFQTAGMLSYPVTVSDGNISIVFTRISGTSNLFIHGIQISE